MSNKLKTTDLIERGWTRGLIKKFLPVPCSVAMNIHSYGFSNLYSLDKIVKTEQSADFQTSQSKSLKKSEKAKKTADKKRAETIKQAQNAEISIETVKIQKLRQLAVNALMIGI